MAAVIWADLAIEDLQSIYEFIAQDSLVYANRTLDHISEKVEQLTDFPLSCATAPEFNNPSIRQLLYKNYRIIYEVMDNSVVILRVVHGDCQL